MELNPGSKEVIKVVKAEDQSVKEIKQPFYSFHSIITEDVIREFNVKTSNNYSFK